MLKEDIEPFIVQFETQLQSFHELSIAIDEFIDSIVPTMDSTPVDGVLADEEEFLILRVE